MTRARHQSRELVGFVAALVILILALLFGSSILDALNPSQ